MTKIELNARLAVPLTTSKLKKTSLASLQAMVDAQQAKLTELEKRVVVAYLDAGIACNGAETLDAMLSDNMTWGDVPAIAKATGLTQKQVQGVISSLSSKGLLVITDEGVNGEGAVQQVLSDDGIRIGFELRAEVVEATAKAAPKKRKPRVLKAHVFCQPMDAPVAIRALTEGSKKHKLAAALLDGATMDELMAATGWRKDVVSSAFQYDMKNSGFGVERRSDQKYYLLMPKGLKRLPVVSKGETRADALVAACE